MSQDAEGAGTALNQGRPQEEVGRVQGPPGRALFSAVVAKPRPYRPGRLVKTCIHAGSERTGPDKPPHAKGCYHSTRRCPESKYIRFGEAVELPEGVPLLQHWLVIDLEDGGVVCQRPAHCRDAVGCCSSIGTRRKRIGIAISTESPGLQSRLTVGHWPGLMSASWAC
jgi:hypothetical protein